MLDGRIAHLFPHFILVGTRRNHFVDPPLLINEFLVVGNKFFVNSIQPGLESASIGGKDFYRLTTPVLILSAFNDIKSERGGARGRREKRKRGVS